MPDIRRPVLSVGNQLLGFAVVPFPGDRSLTRTQIDMSPSRASARRHPAALRFGGARFRSTPAAARLALLLALTQAAAFSTPSWSEEAAGPLHRARAHAACRAGEEACPAVLRMRRGIDLVEAIGWVSAEHPVYYFKFDARGGQRATIHVAGGTIKTGPGIPITFPGGGTDALDVGAPFTLPATGTYVIELHANRMSDGPFGRFKITLRID
jgi:hypothetical protein